MTTMLRTPFALVALLPALLFAAWTPSPDILPSGSRPMRWLGTTIELGDFARPAGAGSLLVVGSIPSRDEVATLTEPVTELPFVPYEYLLFAMSPEIGRQWLAAKAQAGEAPSLGDFAERHGMEAVAFAGSRMVQPEESSARAFRAAYRATLDAAGKPGVERVLFELLDAADEVVAKPDVAPEPFEDGGSARIWTYALVGLALVGGGIWLVTRRRKSS